MFNLIEMQGQNKFSFGHILSLVFNLVLSLVHSQVHSLVLNLVLSLVLSRSYKKGKIIDLFLDQILVEDRILEARPPINMERDLRSHQKGK